MQARVWFSRLRGLFLGMGVLLLLLLLTSQMASVSAQTPPGLGPGNSQLTVTGYGRAVAPADAVLVRLFAGAEPFYGPGGPKFQPPDLESLDLLVAVLAETGVPTDTLSVNPFARGTFGPSTTVAEVRFLYDQPDKLADLLEQVQERLERERGPAIQQVMAVFLVDDCAALEAQAMAQALQKAQERAQMLAAQGDLALGPLLAVEEEGQQASLPFGAQVGGCAGLEAAASASPVGPPFLNNGPQEVEVAVSLDVTYALVPKMALGQGEAVPATPTPLPPETGAAPTPPPVAAPVGKSVTVLAPEVGLPGETKVTVLGGDEEGLREFLKHYLAPSYPSGPAMTITVTVGALPGDLPIQLDLPSGMRPIGSVERRNGAQNIQIILASRLSPAKAVHNLRQQLEEQGFQEPAMAFPGPGPVFVPSQVEFSLFCSPDKKWFVNLSAFEAEEGSTLNLNINSADPFGGPCQEGPPPTVPERMPFARILPQLEPPPGAVVRSQGLSTGQLSVQASAEVIIDWPISRLEAYYEKALEEAGWEQMDASQTEDVAWSSWQAVDDAGKAWSATFTIARVAGRPDTYAVFFHLVRIRG